MKKNLCTDPWIPVLRCSGESVLLSLNDLFAQMEEIRDLVLPPKERISVMRLLICITQQALEGPCDEEDREKCKDRIIPEVKEYLKKWHDAFDFQNDNGGFLQVPNLLKPCETAKGDDDGSMITKLDLSLASGNNATLFDNAGGCERKLSFSQIALGLLTFQNFAPSGKQGVAVWEGRSTAKNVNDKNPSLKAAPCANSALHLFLIGENLLETVWMNLITQEDIRNKGMEFGEKPVWEEMPQSFEDKGSKAKNATSTYLGRLVPLSRCIRIPEDQTEKLILGECFQYPGYDPKKREFFYELSTRLKDNKKELIKGDVKQAIWRSLPALLMADVQILCYRKNLPAQFDLWIGTLVLDKAKVLDEIESKFLQFKKSRIVSEDYSKQLNESLKKAMKGEDQLKKMINEYRECAGFKDNKSGKKEDKYGKAKEIYWSRLGNRQDLFLQTAQTSDGALSVASKKEWEKLIRCSCREAYDAVCPHETERQLEAWVKGWNTFNKKTKKS